MNIVKCFSCGYELGFPYQKCPECGFPAAWSRMRVGNSVGNAVRTRACHLAATSAWCLLIMGSMLVVEPLVRRMDWEVEQSILNSIGASILGLSLASYVYLMRAMTRNRGRVRLERRKSRSRSVQILLGVWVLVGSIAIFKFLRETPRNSVMVEAFGLAVGCGFICAQTASSRWLSLVHRRFLVHRPIGMWWTWIWPCAGVTMMLGALVLPRMRQSDMDPILALTGVSLVMLLGAAIHHVKLVMAVILAVRGHERKIKGLRPST